ncbi:hypothetical protein QBC47DRAFT_370469 [Echria macrotheca]|uniref:Uncharacterized protein n=1 Tax=Echria macrotheca TaxID=438768 RepID=A0AAJ0BIA9_9PEZI|nr:hypothetical protein QBC47DRAFT_370469 [Echria macrotheca]
MFVHPFQPNAMLLILYFLAQLRVVFCGAGNAGGASAWVGVVGGILDVPLDFKRTTYGIAMPCYTACCCWHRAINC